MLCIPLFMMKYRRRGEHKTARLKVFDHSFSRSICVRRRYRRRIPACDVPLTNACARYLPHSIAALIPSKDEALMNPPASPIR